MNVHYLILFMYNDVIRDQAIIIINFRQEYNITTAG